MIYAVWVVGDTPNAFYNVIDVNISGDPVIDTEPPVLTGDPTVATVTGNLVELTWPAATDDIGVRGYVVYRDGVELDRTRTTGYSDRTVQPETTYTYAIRAFDGAGQSELSGTVQVTTGSGSATLTAPSGLHAMGVGLTRVST